MSIDSFKNQRIEVLELSNHYIFFNAVHYIAAHYNCDKRWEERGGKRGPATHLDLDLQREILKMKHMGTVGSCLPGQFPRLAFENKATDTFKHSNIYTSLLQIVPLSRPQLTPTPFYNL